MIVRPGDRVQLLYPAKTMREDGRVQRTLPAGAECLVERTDGGTLIRVTPLEPNPADGRHDIVVTAPALVRPLDARALSDEVD